jgi:hypothetical protein
MKGIVFNLLQEIVCAEHGEDNWEEMLHKAGANGAYTSLGNYPDAEFMDLVGAAASALAMTPDGIVLWFGRRALPLLAQKYPEFFEGHSTRSLLLSLNDIIHPEVRKIYPDADVPSFDYDTSLPDELLMSYRSRRMLCTLGQGLVEGAAAHYGEHATFEHLSCTRRGDAQCQFRIRFQAREAGPDA